MGVLKFVGKVAGTAVLTVTGVSTMVLNSLFEMSGADTTGTLFAEAQDKSFDTIKRIWKPGEYQKYVESGNSELQSIQRRISSKLQAATKLRNLAEKMRSAGNMEKYDEYMERYHYLLEEADDLKKEQEALERAFQ